MSHESSIRLPSRLVGIVRTDSAGQAPTPSPLTLGAEQSQEREQLERVLKSLTQATASLQAHKQQQFKDMERLAVEMAFVVAQRFLERKIQAGEFPFERLIHEAVARLETRRPVTVLLHPEDLALVESRLGENHSFLGQHEVNLAADPGQARGNCKARTEDRGVLFDLAGTLAALRRRCLELPDEATKERAP